MSITHFMYDKWSCINFQTNECIFGLINVFHFDSRGMKNLPRLSWRKWPRFMHRKKRSQKTERRRRWWNLFLIQYNWYAKELIKNFEAPWSFKGKIIAVLKLRQEKRWEACEGIIHLHDYFWCTLTSNIQLECPCCHWHFEPNKADRELLGNRAWLAQVVECWTVMQEVEGSSPRLDQLTGS